LIDRVIMVYALCLYSLFTILTIGPYLWWNKEW
jgi:hypothetical protein